MLAAAFFYSLATVRLSRLAGTVPSLSLATAKSLALAAASLVWLGSAALSNVSVMFTSSRQFIIHSSRLGLDVELVLPGLVLLQC